MGIRKYFDPLQLQLDQDRIEPLQLTRRYEDLDPGSKF